MPRKPSRKRAPELIAARTALQRALRNGALTRPSACEQCGSQKRLHGHHADYSRPLAVRWLCQSCHLQLHARHRRAGGTPISRLADEKHRPWVEDWAKRHGASIPMRQGAVWVVFPDGVFDQNGMGSMFALGWEEAKRILSATVLRRAWGANSPRD